MRFFYDEMARRFPEIRDRFSEGDDELPYAVMGYLSDWLKELAEGEITPQIVDRLVLFKSWCEEQPRGKDAGDDLPTILMVGFYEHLFDSEATRALVPRFISREDFIAGADYLRSWVGAANYEATRRYYKPAVASKRSRRI